MDDGQSVSDDRSCVMGSPRLPLTSMCSVVWLTAFTVNAVNRMDLATGTWQSRAPMPFTSEAPTCALMEATGIVYCAEGDTGNGFAAYNIATDTWTSLAADPFVTDHYGSASGAFNGKVFVVGGTTAFSNAIGYMT